MTLPIAGDTFISDGTYHHILTIATVDNEPMAIASTTTKSQDYPIYARNPETEEILMVEGTGVTKVQRIPSREDENIALPLPAFSETLPDGNPKYERVENYVEDESATEIVEPVVEPVAVESLPEVEDVVEPESVPQVEATVEAVEKTEGETIVEIEVDVPNEEEVEAESQSH